MLDYEKIIDKDEDIALAFIDSWGSVMTSLDTDNSSLSFPLFNPVITPEENLYLTSIPTHKEITDIILHLNSWKAPGPDGLNKQFFKSTRDIISSDVVQLIQSLFSNEINLAEVNKTLLLPIPKFVGTIKTSAFVLLASVMKYTKS